VRFFYVRDDKPIKELSIPFVEAELRACGYDADMRRLYFAKPYKLRCDNDRTLWLVPETLMPNSPIHVLSHSGEISQ